MKVAQTSLTSPDDHRLMYAQSTPSNNPYDDDTLRPRIDTWLYQPTTGARYTFCSPDDDMYGGSELGPHNGAVPQDWPEGSDRGLRQGSTCLNFYSCQCVASSANFNVYCSEECATVGMNQLDKYRLHLPRRYLGLTHGDPNAPDFNDPTQHAKAVARVEGMLSEFEMRQPPEDPSKIHPLWSRRMAGVQAQASIGFWKSQVGEDLNYVQPHEFFSNAPLYKVGDEYTWHIFQPRHPGVANDVRAHSGRVLAMIDDFHDFLVESVVSDRDEFQTANWTGHHFASAHLDQSWRARNWLHRLNAAQFERTNAVMARLCEMEEHLKAVTQDHARMYGEKRQSECELHTAQDELQQARALTASLRAQLDTVVQAMQCPARAPYSRSAVIRAARVTLTQSTTVQGMQPSR